MDLSPSGFSGWMVWGPVVERFAADHPIDFAHSISRRDITGDDLMPFARGTKTTLRVVHRLPSEPGVQARDGRGVEVRVGGYIRKADRSRLRKKQATRDRRKLGS